MVKDSMKEQSSLESSEIFQLLYAIPDPEVAVITIGELGVLRSVDWVNGQLNITITPTYSGCPAMFAIEAEIKTILKENNITDFKLKTVHFPAWTTDWLSDDAKKKLSEYGIAPPQHSSQIKHLRPDEVSLQCPFCNSDKTHLTSWFGSTACKALYFCDNCRQPFEHFKCHH